MKFINKYSKALLIALAVTLLHFGIWEIINRALPLIDAPRIVNGFAYSGYQIGQSPQERKYPSTNEILKDLELLKPYTNRIRIYGALENPETTSLAAQLGFKVTAGAWLGPDKDDNKREMDALLARAALFPNIERIIVGNEAMLRADLNVDEMIGYLEEARRVSRVPVSTAEPWHVWLRYPQLVKHVDFITVHLLPYHEGLPAEKAVDYAFERYRELMDKYPRKKIVIGEIGWPSKGPTIDASIASNVNQALFVREFLAKVANENYDYYLMEAIDQPWKVKIEGWAGAYWGMFDADRHEKYSLNGAVPRDLRWISKALWGSLLAFIPIFFVAVRFRQWGTGAQVSLAVLLQACITVLVVTWNLPGDYYYSLRDMIILVGLIMALLMTSAVLMIYAVEFSEVMFKGYWIRAYNPADPVPAEKQAFVSIHLACYNEPPDMVIATIESLVKLDYKNFEVLVIDNNTKDESKWKPVEAYMATLPDNFKFYHLPQWPGFKAGALNFALQETDPRAEVVGVVDADYVVTTDWLAVLIPHFSDQGVAVVQAPQAHREFENHFFRRMSNWEFEGFFRIGMHHRHERNALIQHGTMTLVRRKSLVDLGGWSEWCICEDTELGLRLLEGGYELRYIDRTFGRGLTPANFEALKSQRFRWAFGAMQILKHHMPKLLGKSNLSFGQRYHFLTGWFGWMGDGLQLIFTMSSIGWTLAMLAFPKSFSLPVSIMLTPVLCFLVVKGALGPILYRKTMDCKWSDILGASLAGLGLSHTIARGIMMGLIQKRGVFKTTNKGKAVKGSIFSLLTPIREEVLLLLALIVSAWAMMLARGVSNLDAQLWVTMLTLQSLPYLSTLACQIIAQLPDKPVKNEQ